MYTLDNLFNSHSCRKCEGEYGEVVIVKGVVNFERRTG